MTITSDELRLIKAKQKMKKNVNGLEKRAKFDAARHADIIRGLKNKI